MNLKLTLAALAIAAFSGCSTTARPGTYECELHESAAAKCASMEQAYKASQGTPNKDASTVQSVFERNARGTPGTTPVAPIVGAQVSGYPEVGEAGMPVFKQPKVLRVWVAPYVDADGNLRSGEYTYFSTPGQWNYGDLKKPGAAAAGMFAPARTDNLGFTPAAKPAPTVAPVKPAEAARPEIPGPAGAVPQGGAAISGGALPATAPITQPYQRLNSN